MTSCSVKQMGRSRSSVVNELVTREQQLQCQEERSQAREGSQQLSISFRELHILNCAETAQNGGVCTSTVQTARAMCGVTVSFWYV